MIRKALVAMLAPTLVLSTTARGFADTPEPPMPPRKCDVVMSASIQVFSVPTGSTSEVLYSTAW